MSIQFHLPVGYDADVVVVGAGPAGASAAYHLAGAGVDVLMLDGSSFPRDKVCGDFVGPVALAELADLGVTVRADFQRTNRIVGASLHLDGKHMVTRNLPAVERAPAVRTGDPACRPRRLDPAGGGRRRRQVPGPDEGHGGDDATRTR